MKGAATAGNSPSWKRGRNVQDNSDSDYSGEDERNRRSYSEFRSGGKHSKPRRLHSADDGGACRAHAEKFDGVGCDRPKPLRSNSVGGNMAFAWAGKAAISEQKNIKSRNTQGHESRPQRTDSSKDDSDGSQDYSGPSDSEERKTRTSFNFYDAINDLIITSSRKIKRDSAVFLLISESIKVFPNVCYCNLKGGKGGTKKRVPKSSDKQNKYTQTETGYGRKIKGDNIEKNLNREPSVITRGQRSSKTKGPRMPSKKSVDSNFGHKRRELDHTDLRKRIERARAHYEKYLTQHPDTDESTEEVSSPSSEFREQWSDMSKASGRKTKTPTEDDESIHI